MTKKQQQGYHTLFQKTRKNITKRTLCDSYDLKPHTFSSQAFTWEKNKIEGL